MVQSSERRAPALPGPRTAAFPALSAEYDSFFNHAYPVLLKTAMMVGASPHEAEDAAAGVMKYVYQHWKRIDNPLAYACKSVINAVTKAKGRDGELVLRTIAGCLVTPEAENDTSLTAWEDQDWVLSHLRKLPPAQREVMACVVDGRSSAEIAALFGKTEATVRKNLQFARERLRRQMAEEQDHELHHDPRSHGRRGGRPDDQ